MPARVSRSSVRATGARTVRKNNRKRNLDAYSEASKLIPSDTGVRRNRLGESLGDDSKPKRRKLGKISDGEVDDDSEASEPAIKRNGQQDLNAGDAEHGSDSEGNTWTLGGLREDDEDSELDSDEAFGDSDEERFAGFAFRGSSSSSRVKSMRQRQSLVNQKDNGIELEDSSDGEEDDDLGEEGVDLATMLDDDNDHREGLQAEVDENSANSDSSDEDDDESSRGSGDSDVEVQNERMARMRDRIDALDGMHQAESLEEALPTSTALTVEDLLADLDPAARKQYSAPLKTRKQSERPKTLAAPLAPRHQARIDRAVASRKAKEQLDRWQDTVMHNRRADFLSFPLRDPDGGEQAGKDRFVPSTPQNELEAHIQKIMEDSGLAEQPSRQEDEENAIIKSEGLAEKKMSIEEVARRRAELRRARDLLFREEIKAKRIAKIKSKAYRRVHRREKERNAIRDASDDGENEKEARADRKRAEARMNTKHKDSKWAKALKATNRTVWDDDARTSVNEQARRKENLRERIAGRELSDDEGSDASDVVAPDGEDGYQTMEQLKLLHEGDNNATMKTGLAGMKFMQAADERRRKRNEEEVEQLRKELADEEGSSGGENIPDQELGRAIFGPKGKEALQPGNQVKHLELEEGDVSDEEVEHQAAEADQVVIKTDAPVDRVRKSSRAQTVLTFDAEDNSNVEDPSAPEQTSEDQQNITSLHRRAFAGDNVKAAFDAEKADAIASDEEKEVSNHLPGWGSWTGEGLSKSIRKANNRQRHNPIYKTKLAGVKAQDRKDAKLENVLVSEKQDRKGKKYKADILPHEYEKKQQYERSLRLPLGPEWVTKETFQEHTRPRVVVKPGVIVAPMERPLL